MRQEIHRIERDLLKLQEPKDKSERKVKNKMMENLKTMQVDLSTRETKFFVTEGESSIDGDFRKPPRQRMATVEQNIDYLKLQIEGSLAKYLRQRLDQRFLLLRYKERHGDVLRSVDIMQKDLFDPKLFGENIQQVNKVSRSLHAKEQS